MQAVSLRIRAPGDRLRKLLTLRTALALQGAYVEPRLKYAQMRLQQSLALQGARDEHKLKFARMQLLQRTLKPLRVPQDL
ncbi:uncharacterized protein L3040_008544 [Drepanopeziza brunnea f. sp. 'multigermtubi']|uniref:uncharacterized protein n=1 Tax=Drepanopeziza brunnea f. sp. 'multigermtubi' TaxID=698441 RepID=UPI00239B02B9|nr:hypothetical protein L3040_008544 [Drepanopeziza brunnea f. sp. 'multigermtubi']